MILPPPRLQLLFFFSCESRNFILFIFQFLKIYLFELKASYFTILQWFLPNIYINQPQTQMCSLSRIPLPPPFPSHPPGSSQCTSPGHPVLCIKPGLAICFTYNNIHVSTLPSQTIPPLPSLPESKRLFYISVSFLLSHIQGHCYHLSNSIYMCQYTILEESEKVGLKLNIQKTTIMSSGPIIPWEIDGETVETVSDFILGGSKITADGDCSHEIKRCLLLRTYLTSGSTTKPQSSRQYGTVKKTEIQINGTKQKAQR